MTGEVNKISCYIVGFQSISFLYENHVHVGTTDRIKLWIWKIYVTILKTLTAQANICSCDFLLVITIYYVPIEEELESFVKSKHNNYKYFYCMCLIGLDKKTPSMLRGQ